MKDDIDPKDVCEFHLGYNQEQTHYQIVVASSVKLDTDLLMLALESFIDEMKDKNVDLFDMGSDYLIIGN